MDAKEFVERSVAQLTKNKATVLVREDKFGAVFEIFSTENASLIGKHRATINSIRVVAKALGINDKHRIRIVLRERDKKLV